MLRLRWMVCLSFACLAGLACSENDGPPDEDAAMVDSGDVDAAADAGQDGSRDGDVTPDSGSVDGSSGDAGADSGSDAAGGDADARDADARDADARDADARDADGRDAGAGSPTCSDECTPTCFRPINCVLSCGGEVAGCGCCACEPPAFDDIACD